MKDVIKKCYEHYQNLDRAYILGNPVYRFNDVIFIFGEECEYLKSHFNEWYEPYSFAKIENFARSCDGIEYMIFQTGWWDSIEKTIRLYCIDYEEVCYGFFQCS